MKQVKTLRIIVVALIVLNIAFMTFHFTRFRPHRPNETQMRDMIVKKLELSDAQSKEYDELIKMHQVNMKRLMDEKLNVKERLYKLLDGKNDHENGQAQLIARLGGIQVEIEALHYEHFNRLRQICTEEQLPHYKELQNKLVHIFSPEPPKGKRR